MRVLTHSRHDITALAFSPDGRWLAVGETRPNVMLHNCRGGEPVSLPQLQFSEWLRFTPGGLLLSLSVGRPVVAFDLKAGRLAWQGPSQGTPCFFDVSPDVTQFVSSDGDGVICLDQRGELLWDVAPDARGPLLFAPDGRSLVVVDDVIQILDGGTGTVVDTFDREEDGVATDVCGFSPDSLRVAYHVVPHDIVILDLTAGRRVLPTVTAPGGLHAAAFSPDGRTLMTAGRDGLVRLWDVATGRGAAALDLGFGGQEVRALAFAPDGLTAAVSGSAGRLVLFDTG